MTSTWQAVRSRLDAQSEEHETKVRARLEAQRVAQEAAREVREASAAQQCGVADEWLRHALLAGASDTQPATSDSFTLGDLVRCKALAKQFVESRRGCWRVESSFGKQMIQLTASDLAKHRCANVAFNRVKLRVDFCDAKWKATLVGLPCEVMVIHHPPQ